jgi:hypothetical protein
MENLFDAFSKSLAESVSRRDTLRLLGAVFTGAVLTPLGLGTAWAGGPDPCKTFCNCPTRAQQSQCLAACTACNGVTSHVCGSCGNYACDDLLDDPNCGACGNNCGAIGETCCGDHCADLANDVNNCGACGSVCAAAPANEVVTCEFGTCDYDCAPGTLDCNGTCTPVNSDPANCGACGHVCAASTPYCSGGVCSDCPPPLTDCGICVDLNNDNANCGACFVFCADGFVCSGGTCVPSYP